MVQQSVLEKVSSEMLSVHVVWTPVLAGDSFEAAQEARSLVPDPRALHYWDGDQALGLAYGKVLELPRGRELAWDIYFAYAAELKWNGTLPSPSDWVHQLGMDDRNLGDGIKLRESVERLLSRLEPGVGG